MKDKEKANDIALKYASYDDTFQDCFDTAVEMAQWKEQQMVENAVSNCAEMLVRIERDLFSEGIKTLENRDNIAEIFERGFQFFKQTMMKE